MAPAIMIDDELVVQGCDIDEEKLALIIVSATDLYKGLK
jgi:hypothetical protein